MTFIFFKGLFDDKSPVFWGFGKSNNTYLRIQCPNSKESKFQTQIRTKLKVKFSTNTNLSILEFEINPKKKDCLDLVHCTSSILLMYKNVLVQYQACFSLFEPRPKFFTVCKEIGPLRYWTSILTQFLSLSLPLHQTKMDKQQSTEKRNTVYVLGSWFSKKTDLKLRKMEKNTGFC